MISKWDGAKAVGSFVTLVPMRLQSMAVPPDKTTKAHITMMIPMSHFIKF